ncbi:NF-kappa-B essential modulator [Varanus komodoensis]|nr:NF-kappa-B essential modulator [Varanus komodoensis]
MYTNARSMGNKQEELEALLGIGGYGLVGITETWWDERQVWNVNIEGKAFDKVPHDILVEKLRSFRIHQSTVRWIRAWLTDRKQKGVREDSGAVRMRLLFQGKDSQSSVLVHICVYSMSKPVEEKKAERLQEPLSAPDTKRSDGQLEGARKKGAKGREEQKVAKGGGGDEEKSEGRTDGWKGERLGTQRKALEVQHSVQLDQMLLRARQGAGLETRVRVLTQPGGL